MLANARVADTLAEAGHDVTLFEPDFLKLYDKIETSKIAKRVPVFGFSDALWTALQELSGDVFEEKSFYRTISNNNIYMRAYNEHCEDLLNRDELIAQLRAEKFDAYFGEQINLCGHGLARAIGIRTYFWISSCPVDDIISYKLGLPMPASYASSLIGYRLPTNPTFFQRMYNVMVSIGYIYFICQTDHDLSLVFKRKFGPDFPDLGEIAADSDLLFVMTDEFLEVQKPLMPNFIHVGGLEPENEKDSQTLDEKTSKEVEKGKNGIVYFSLGTTMNSSMLQPFVMKTVMETVKQFPDYHFIVKVDGHDPNAWKYSKNIENVFVTDWVAQRALLKHPRIRAFITHSGYNGMVEAALAGIPLVTIPFMFDQTR
ncbi:hypothetical protein WR25_10536 isoform B [Diploscapter pachys]|nr:hypothetical protein WR25_10536 isoform B [Diploscapter pachys]